MTTLFKTYPSGEFVRLDATRLECVQVWPAPRNPYATGYGLKIPTSWRVKYNGAWRRVYCACFSNIGSCYVLVKGERFLIDNIGVAAQ